MRLSDTVAVVSLFFFAHFHWVYSRMQLFGVSASGVSKDTVLGPYPKTPEERAAAAKKYNMRVEDYEPYPENGEG